MIFTKGWLFRKKLPKLIAIESSFMLKYSWKEVVLMRVISGSARGTHLKTLEGLNTRPTTDRIKESMFNLIQSYIYDKDILDLFSGSGGLGIEALSRGGSSAVFVEKHKKAVKIIEENLTKTRLLEKATIMNNDVEDALRRLSQNNRKFDLVILDPPYSKDLIIPVLKSLFEGELVEKEGIVVIEHEKSDILEEDLFGFQCIKTKRYGITSISIYKEK